MAARASSDGAKLAVLWWGLLAFIGSGFEHSIANVTTFAMGALQGTSDWGDLARNLAWTIPGNIVGGALLVGFAYGWLGKVRTPAPTFADELASLPVNQLAALTPEPASR
jgi:nitrite transporter NirC